jgi:hypothetical protein
VMVDADFSAANAAEVFLRLIGASPMERVRFLVVVTFDFKSFMQVVP